MDARKSQSTIRGLGRLLLEYLSVAGSVFFLVTFVLNVRWKEAAAILTSVTGQAVCVAFGAIAILCLWIAGKMRSNDTE